MRTVIVVTLGRSGRVASNETLSQRQRRLAEEADVNGEGTELAMFFSCQGSRQCITSGNLRHPKRARFVGNVRIK